MHASISEPQSRSRDEILHGPRRQHLARSGQRRDPSGRVDGDTANIVPDAFDLSGVDPGADLETQTPDSFGDGHGTPDRASRPVEGGEEAVPRRVDLLSAEVNEFGPHSLVMVFEYLPPFPVAQGSSPIGRSDNVREQ